MRAGPQNEKSNWPGLNIKFSLLYCTKKMKFSIKGFFSKCDKIQRKLPIWSHLLNKSLIKNYTLNILESRNGIKMNTYVIRYSVIKISPFLYSQRPVWNDFFSSLGDTFIKALIFQEKEFEIIFWNKLSFFGRWKTVRI